MFPGQVRRPLPAREQKEAAVDPERL